MSTAVNYTKKYSFIHLPPKLEESDANKAKFQILNCHKIYKLLSLSK
jgi:hypothetical protein